MSEKNNPHKEETRYMLPNTIIAMSMLSATKKKKPINTYELSEKLVELKNKGIDIGGIYIQRVALGYFSEYVEQLWGSFQIAGDATGRNPGKLNESGVELCQEIIQDAIKEYPTEIRDIAKYLNMDNKFT